MIRKRNAVGATRKLLLHFASRDGGAHGGPPATRVGSFGSVMVVTSPPPVAAGPATLVVGVIADFSKQFFRDIVGGIGQYGREVGDWRLRMIREPADVLAAQHAWNEQGIIACLRDPRIRAAVASAGLPVVAVGSLGDEGLPAGVLHVDTDNDRIAGMAFEHLCERGLRHFAYCGLRPGVHTRWSVDRGDRFEAHVAAAGHTCARWTMPESGATSDESQRGLCRWLAELPKPVGILACADEYAAEVIEACRSAGLRVPFDVAVVGVDNDELTCELTVPPLTSVAQAAGRIGYEAARLLDRSLARECRGARPNGQRVPRSTFVPPTTVVARGSTQTIAVADPTIAQMLEMVRAGACDGLTIADLIDVAGLPRWKLEKRFKDVVGHSIHEDIVRVRLAEARRLIQTTSLPLKSVARRSGFRTVAYMTTIFGRRFGITPARFRRFERGSVVPSSEAISEP